MPLPMFSAYSCSLLLRCTAFIILQIVGATCISVDIVDYAHGSYKRGLLLLAMAVMVTSMMITMRNIMVTMFMVMTKTTATTTMTMMMMMMMVMVMMMMRLMTTVMIVMTIMMISPATTQKRARQCWG